MGGFIAGAVALLAAGGLAVATTIGVVNTVNKTPENTKSSVVNYGTKPATTN